MKKKFEQAGIGICLCLLALGAFKSPIGGHIATQLIAIAIVIGALNIMLKAIGIGVSVPNFTKKIKLSHIVIITLSIIIFRVIIRFKEKLDGNGWTVPVGALGDVKIQTLVIGLILLIPAWVFFKSFCKNPLAMALAFAIPAVVVWVFYAAATGETLDERFEDGWFNRHRTYMIETESGDRYWKCHVVLKSFSGTNECVTLRSEDRRVTFLLQQTPEGYAGHWEYKLNPSDEALTGGIDFIHRINNTWSGQLGEDGRKTPITLF